MNPNENPSVTPTEAPQESYTPGVSNAPTPPADPTPAPQPAPTETPAPAPTDAPTATPPTTPTTATEAQQQDYGKYLDDLIAQAGINTEEIQVPKRPSEEELGKDDQALTKFFSDLVDTSVKKSVAESNRNAIIMQAETAAWGEMLQKYPEIKDSPGLLNTIQNIRVGLESSGKRMSPLQVADQLIGDLRNQYKKGVNDTNVTTTVRDSQPTGGANPTPVSPSVDYGRLQDGGKDAAVIELTKLIEQNKI